MSFFASCFIYLFYLSLLIMETPKKQGSRWTSSIQFESFFPQLHLESPGKSRTMKIQTQNLLWIHLFPRAIRLFVIVTLLN